MMRHSASFMRNETTRSGSSKSLRRISPSMAIYFKPGDTPFEFRGVRAIRLEADGPWLRKE